jgi:uncharacterized protein
MLTGDLVRPRLRQRDGQLRILLLDSNRQQLHTATDLIALSQQYVDQSQSAWNTALEKYEGDRLDYIVIRGLAKVLSDAATFTPIETPIAPDELRRRLFELGPVFAAPDLFHPHTRTDMLATTADELEIAPQDLERTLFADRSAEYLLTDAGQEWTAETLIARYNLELSRAALYWSDRMDVDIYDTFKEFWRYLKLFKLMFWATPIDGGGYHVEMDGPISPFVQSTTRYGRQFAAFLPALFLCEKWSMEASTRPPQFDKKLRYSLDNSSTLSSHFGHGGEFDSKMEANFAAEFHAKFGDERGQWILTREDEVILLGDTVMIPDFAFTHKKDGRRALIEIVGFWHPEYLRRKIKKVRAANRSDLILLVYEGVNLTAEKLRDVPAEMLYFKKKPVLKDVLALVEQVAK